MGAMNLPRPMPIRYHILLIGVKIFEFSKPKIKNKNDIINGNVFTSLKLPLKFQKAIIKKRIKKTIPNDRFELIFELYDILSIFQCFSSEVYPQKNYKFL